MIQDDTRSEKIWQGSAVSSGVAHAVVHVLKDDFDEPDEDAILPEEVETDLARWHKALEVTREEIEALQKVVAEEQGGSEADIFEAHLLILHDNSILKQVEKTVREKLICVDAVYYRLMCKHMDALRGLADSYLRERFLDIKDITHRVMRHLRGEIAIVGVQLAGAAIELGDLRVLRRHRLCLLLQRVLARRAALRKRIAIATREQQQPESAKPRYARRKPHEGDS